MRSREPDASGDVERDGVKLYYEVFGDGDPTVLLLPTWSIVHSRAWKAQIGYLARKHRVVTFDGRGNGRSGSPAAAEAYTHREFVADTIAVMDATDTDRAVLVALSMGALWGTQLAADKPDRVLGLVCIGPAVPFGDRHPDREAVSFDDELDTTDGWAKYNRHYWVDGDYHDFLGFFFGQMFSEPHSTKQIEDCVGWGHEIAPETLVATQDGASTLDAQRFRDTCGRVDCPVLVIHGHEDAIRAHESGVAFAEATGGSLVTITGGGHGPLARDPVKTNLLIEEFIGTVSSTPPTRRLWTRALNRPKRALYVSSPIGLGHARRDIAIAQELRRLHPDLEIDWLAQHPVTTVLSSDGERIHPASAHLTASASSLSSRSRSRIEDRGTPPS
ncbi:MAG: alpha/beta fold hydrolase [Jiangellaceae bacterium]